ncbi:hypothetical protein BDW74DRAFT_184352 [Aspergillus multicolor]|uniref:uncharacterized protein n=1 Tax=Aspergillus multicolor TaxID=41759 RepID=UPI003CCD936B
MGSNTGNGYRGALRSQLRYVGWEVNMVGSKSNGDMNDNDVEAHSGDLITEVHAASRNSYIYKPNITLIILLTLLPSGNANIARNTPIVNTQYRELVNAMCNKDKSIILAKINGDDSFLEYPSDFSDDTHPNNTGYAKMARIYGVCEKQYGDGIYAGGLTQRGSGEEDGIYYHDIEAKGVVFSISIPASGREDLDDYDWAVRYEVYWNVDGQGAFESAGPLSVTDNCNPAGVHFVDINGDGYNDFICIRKDGTTYASINNHDGSNSNLPTFTYKGKWKDREGYNQANVRLADIDGDGRADYCVVAGSGDISCWRNGWIDDMPAYWQALGVRFTGKGMGDIAGVRFEDINGDGRDDWLWLDDVGQTTTYINARSCQKADGNRYCNMMGHSDGRMDYIWILSKGDMRIYPNKGLTNITDSGESYWDANYTIFNPSLLSIARDLDRRDLHLADWDGDGACDIIWTDPDNTNKPHLFRNRIKETGDFN